MEAKPNNDSFLEKTNNSTLDESKIIAQSKN
jgi:hypothetical protein